MKRWLKRIVLAILLVGVLAIGGAVIFIHTEYGRDVVKSRVEDALTQSFPGGVHVGSLEFGVFGEIVIRDVRIDLPDHRPELIVKEARVDLARMPLLGKSVHVEHLVLDDVTFTVPPPAPPKPETKPSAPGESSSWSIEIDDIELHRGHVIRDPVDVTDLDVAGTLRLNGDELTGVVAATAKVAGQPVSALGTVRIADGAIDVPLARVEALGARVNVIGARLVGGMAHEGAVLAVVPAGALHTLAAVDLPGDAKAVVTIHEGLVASDIVVGTHSARAMVSLDVTKPEVKGLVIANDPRGMAIAAIDARPDSVRGVVSGFFDDLGGAIAVDGTDHGGLLVAGVNGKRIHGGLVADVTRDHDTWEITRSYVDGNVRNLGQLRGEVEAYFSATGRAWPDPDLRIDGSLDGDHAGWGNISMTGLHVAIADLRVPAHPRGRLHVDIDGAADGATPLGSLKLDAHGEGSRDGTGELVIDAHTLATPGATWSGSGGTIAFAHDKITVKGMQTATGTARVGLDGTYDAATDDLSAKIAATDVVLAALAPEMPGTASADLTVSRRGGRWSGGGNLHARGLVVHGEKLDADADLALAGRRVTLHASGTSPSGTAKATLDVDGPRDLTDANAWLALDRRALREASLELDQVTQQGITADGKVTLSSTSAGGAFRITGIQVHGGNVSAQIGVDAAAAGDLAVNASATDGGVANATAVAMIDLPVRLFDPAAWKALGKNALKSATIDVAEQAFDPDVLAKLGVLAPFRGKVSAKVEVATGGTGATADVKLTGFAGGLVIRPIDVAIAGALDQRGLSGTATVSSDGKPLIQALAHSPFTLDYGDIRRAPVTGTITFPDTPAKSLLAIFGRTDIVGGFIGGTVDVAGTFGTPTAHAQLAAHYIEIAQGLAQKKPVVLTEARLDAKWGGVAGSLELVGNEANGGTLRVTADGRPDALSSFAIKLDATKFDLAPLAALAPGPLVAAGGTLDASLEVRGLDPQTGDVRGELHLTNGKLPLAPTIGTVHRAKLDINVANRTIDAKLTARLGQGDITGSGKLVMAGARPSSAEFSLTLAKVSPVGAIEPLISAEVSGQLAYADRWTGKVDIRHGTISIPATSRNAILDAGAPSDMLFVDAPPPIAKPVHRTGPSHPWLVATVDIGATQIDADNLQDFGSGHVVIDGQMVISVGDGIGYDGSISARRGDIELLGRAYQVDHATFTFDGTLDPLLDLSLVHDFQDVSLTADVHGRASAPDLALSSDPSIYTPGQLLGFFLGGEPGGDPASASLDAATGAGASVLSTKVGAEVRKHIPLVKLDVLSYEAGTSTTSGSVRAGIWINHKLFVQYRNRPEHRPDENGNEGDIEYYLPRNWLLQGVVGDQDVDGLDLLHRWRW